MTASPSPITTDLRGRLSSMHGMFPRGCWLLTAALLLLLGATGCGRRLYPVHGTVALEDGTPLTRGLVVFEGHVEGAAVMARGAVQTDGRYQLSTDKPGDGAPPGLYRVLIN